MQTENETDDVGRLLNVLGVPSLPYQSFRQPPSVQGFDAARVADTAAATRLETSFPLLAAALPALADAVVSSAPPAEQPEYMAETTKKIAADHPVESRHNGMDADAAAKVKSMPFDARASAPRQSMPHKPADAARSPKAPAPPPRGETPIRGVFNVLRGVPVRHEAESSGQRGIRTLFDRP